MQALKSGKEIPDSKVEHSLFERATGYNHEAVKIFMPAKSKSPIYAPYTEHYAPDPTSMIFWLKNRRPDRWRDKVDLEHSGKIITQPADLSKLTLEERETLADLLEKAEKKELEAAGENATDLG
jgi:hypothetical protein